MYERWEVLVPSIARSVHRHCPASIEIEDLEQIGRLALAIASDKYDEGREASWPTYARMRIRGAMIDAIRGPEFREACRERDAVRIDALPPALPVGKVAQIPPREPWIDRAIAELPARQARVIELRYRDDLTQTETARRMGVSRMTISRDERLALERMRGQLAKTRPTEEYMSTDVNISHSITEHRAEPRTLPDFYIARALPPTREAAKVDAKRILEGYVKAAKSVGVNRKAAKEKPAEMRKAA